jgi:hypothetical protein
MCKKTIITTGLSVFLFLALVSAASAGDIGTEAGDWEYKFDSPDSAVEGYQYDQEALSRVGTEAGDWEYRYDAPETNADIAAKNYPYDQESMGLVGTEAGDWEYKANGGSSGHMGNTANEAIADDSKVKDAVCKGC